MAIPIFKFSNKYARLLSAISISLWALYLRFERLASRELWGDEVYQLHQTLGPFKAVWKRNVYGDMTCFPGDYLLTYPFAQVFGSNKWGLALPHAAVTVIGFYFLYRICQRHFKTVWGYIIAFSVVCFNQHLIFNALELRPYAVLPTLALAVFYYTDILMTEAGRLSTPQKIFIGGFFVLTMWFHAFGIMIVGCSILFFLLSEWRQPSLRSHFKNIAGTLAIVFLIALPVWLWFATGNPLKLSSESYHSMRVGTFDYIANPLDGFGRFFNRVVFYNLIGFKDLYFLLGILIIAILVPSRERPRKFGLFLTLVLLPIAVILVVDLSNRYWFLIRQYIYVAPLFAFFLGWLWDSSIDYYRNKSRRELSFTSVVGLVMLTVCTLAGIMGMVF